MAQRFGDVVLCFSPYIFRVLSSPFNLPALTFQGQLVLRYHDALVGGHRGS